MSFATDPPSRILSRLQISHKGQKHAIKAPALAADLGISDREVREIIHDLRVTGEPICSGAHGFYWPVSREDAGPCIAWIASRFQQMRASYEGYMRGLDREFGQSSLFDEEVSA
ncbi:MAG: hypothetical protein M1455_06270 [Actinobacteria bacterium]|nr:hypothetical protein [Actinomycetota bacterium]